MNIFIICVRKPRYRVLSTTLTNIHMCMYINPNTCKNRKYICANSYKNNSMYTNSSSTWKLAYTQNINSQFFQVTCTKAYTYTHICIYIYCI